MNQDQPLKGIKVIDCATVLAGPLIGQILGDFGAEVIKIEHPGRGDSFRNLGAEKNGVPLWWKIVSRNKLGITLNLSSTDGQALFKDLIVDADILIENFRPGVMERWNLGYEDLRKINKKIIMVRTTGFGQDGPYKNRPGFGTLAEVMSGFAHVTGFPEGPPTLPPLGLADSVAALCGVYSAVMALYYRDCNNEDEGQCIDLSIYEPLFSILGSHAIEYDQLGIIQERTGNRIPVSAPRNLYKTKDDKWVAISGSTQSITERIFKAIEREDLINDPRFKNNKSRLENVEELDNIISDWMGKHNQQEILDKFENAEAAIFTVYNIADIFKDPQYKYRNSIIEILDNELGMVKMQNVIPKMQKTPGKIKHTGPRLGEHNEEVYVNRLGLSLQKLEKLKKEGVI